MATFDAAIPVILEHEGGYVNNVHDDGGATNFGISDRADGKVDGKIDLNRDGKTLVDPAELTRDQAVAYYRKFYWRPEFEQIKSQAVATQLFDITVNSGYGVVPKMVQRAVNAAGGHLVVDGVMGAGTITALNALDENVFLRKLTRERAMFYVGLVEKNPSQIAFLRSWLGRIFA